MTKNLVRIGLILALFLINASLVPKLHLGIAAALLLNFFYRREESFYLSLGFGLLADLFFLQTFGLPRSLVLLLLTGGIEWVKHALFRDAPDLVNGLQVMAVLSGGMNIPILVYAVNAATVQAFVLGVAGDLAAFFLLYVAAKPFLRVRTMLQYEQPLLR